jgi:uncharacterized protein YdeI (YjbR/CyaY-like superfamily)
MSSAERPEILRAESIGAWREWLRENHLTRDAVWLVFRKKGEGDVPFGYHEALDEALCYGWVDSLLKSIDKKEYMRKFSRRRPTSTWSEINKKRVAQLIVERRMAPAGMRAVEEAKKNGMWEKGVERPEVDDTLPGALLAALRSNPAARDNYFRMSRSCQRQYNIWINMARRAETTRRRVEESVRLLERGEELGLK